MKKSVLVLSGLVAATAAQVSPQQQQASSSRHQTLLPGLTNNELEASFLKVSRSCKVSVRSFEAVQIPVESVSAQVLALHAELDGIA